MAERGDVVGKLRCRGREQAAAVGKGENRDQVLTGGVAVGEDDLASGCALDEVERGQRREREGDIGSGVLEDMRFGADQSA